MKEDDPLHAGDLEQAYRVAYLIAGHIRKTLTARERAELDAWLEASEDNIILFEDLIDEDRVQRTLDWYNRLNSERKAAMLERLKERLPFVPSRSRGLRRWLPFSIAAAVFLLVGLGLVVWMKVLRKEPLQAVAQQEIKKQAVAPGDVAPGGNRATLMLGNGRTLVLDSAANGRLVVEGNTVVHKDDGSLSYAAEGPVGIKQEPVINVLRTPRGGQYHLVLNDGTGVWLNAGSSLRFPTAFTGHERVVTLEGEGYFEVVHNPARPFRVRVGNVVVEDLGTTFNINAYGDEGGVQTTLVSGALQVESGDQKQRLRPGETATAVDGSIRTESGRVAAAVGWKEGRFVFHDTPLPVVLNELERWYNISIQNPGGASMHLNATIDRDVPLQKMLQLLQGQGGLQFRWNGNQLTVVR